MAKKKFKYAVDRNLLKRRMREAYRLNKEKFKVEAEKSFAFAIILNSNKLVEYQEIKIAINALAEKFVESNRQRN